MADYRRRGHRIRVRPGVITMQGTFHREYGTIISEQDNRVGRVLVSVELDGKGQALFFEEEIEEVEES